MKSCGQFWALAWAQLGCQRRPRRPSSDSNAIGAEDITPSLQSSQQGSSDLNPMGQQMAISNPLGQGGSASSSSMDSHAHCTPSSSSSPRICRYDVFLSFRGPDTRNSFIDHLYAHLIRKGIFVFKDDQSLQKGESLSPQLLQAIKDSRLSIIVFSKNYAKSTWCLDEMAAIAECQKELKQIVFPVFYDIDPSHVRKQEGEYKNAFVLHTQKFKHDLGKVDGWKRAMTSLAGLVGWDIRGKTEFREIEIIIQEVIKSLGHRFSGSDDDLIGIQPRVEVLENLLKLSSEDDGVQVIGIWGMGGIGKTTLTHVLYDKISYQFDVCCFIENVSEFFRRGGVVAVQKQILRQTIDEKNLEQYDPSDISKMIRNRLHNIKVLVVLDNVDQFEQLEELAINPKLLHTKSRMIITTRDEHILNVYGVRVVHEVPLLNDKDARELFYRKAFKTEDSNSSCVELIPEVLQYAQRLPLAIRVLGSFLCARDATMWRDALDRLRIDPHHKIRNVLQVSVNGLQYHEKEIFLHIACFFKREREDYVKRVLHACDLFPHIGIQTMIQKSLITIRNQEIHMHEMLQELGKQIVRHQYHEKPGSWSRLWLDKDFHKVLMTESGTDNIEAIVLNQKENVSECRAEGLSKMMNLKLLILNDKNFSGKLNFLSNNLQYLLWHGYPFSVLPWNFEPCNLVELNMPRSSIQQLWEGSKHLPRLKRMDLSNSGCLKETPDFEGIPELQRLDLTGCISLLQVHPSIGILTKLVFLSLRNCSSLVSLDFGSASNLSSLKVLHLSGCTKLENTFLVGASNLEYLDMDQCTSLSMVHESIGSLTSLRFLSLRDCTNLVSIPNNINTMTSIITLHLGRCFKLENLPLTRTLNSYNLNSLILMDISFCNLFEVPDAIGELRCLERLNLEGNNFISITSSIENLDHLAYLNLAHCRKLGSLPKIPSINAISGGRYFKMVSGSRDHRSGLYIFECPDVACQMSVLKFSESLDEFQWVRRLLEQPCHFRCGFDIIVPLYKKDIDSPRNQIIPSWFDHQFDGGSTIRIMHFNVDDSWNGFAFCVAFKVSNLPIACSPDDSFSSRLPHPFYLSFESEYTEERFDIPLNLEINEIYQDYEYFWIIYISRKHCHFVKNGACITFKARPDLMMKQWGLRMLTMQDIEALKMGHIKQRDRPLDNLVIDHVKERKSSGPKIQLPYNWFVSDEDEVENCEAKSKENNLSNLGF